jgi:hypothetical protein
VWFRATVAERGLDRDVVSSEERGGRLPDTLVKFPKNASPVWFSMAKAVGHCAVDQKGSMQVMTIKHVDVEHLLTLTAQTAPPTAVIAGAPQGTRGILGIAGGSFEGPRLKGTIVPPGGDWFTIRPSGILKLDVRLLLVTDDNAHILMTYSGVAVPGEHGLNIRIAPLFEAPEGPYSWLSDVQAIGYGERVETGVRYDIYGLR